ncbi:hypothetical protein Dda3937_01844 [Dickeya dadantii 3937]|uniref:Uncharacterized protein n=1 Tax=Dickeya dadantii (strain 3937) TaxID=198628 RepID=E0SKD3_DICD3|nr:hypothetical protein Dda3937_01844 [Dickeya dadantii 3937]
MRDLPDNGAAAAVFSLVLPGRVRTTGRFYNLLDIPAELIQLNICCASGEQNSLMGTRRLSGAAWTVYSMHCQVTGISDRLAHTLLHLR